MNAVFMTMNGTPRTVYVPDDRVDESTGGGKAVKRKKAGPSPLEVGAPMPGSVVEVNVAVGDTVAKGQKLCSLSAMKMVVVVSAPSDGVIKDVLVEKGDVVASQDLVVEMSAE